MNRPKNLLDMALYAFCAVAIGLTLYRLGGDSLVRALEVRPASSAAIALEGVDWSSHKATLVMVVQAGCRWCTASAPMYRQILRSRPSALRVLAVAPGEPAETRQYLESLGVAVDDIRKAKLDSLGVEGTPTLFVVDSKGLIGSRWVGKLPPEREASLLATLGIQQAPDAK